jgi:hypothetical protein
MTIGKIHYTKPLLKILKIIGLSFLYSLIVCFSAHAQDNKEIFQQKVSLKKQRLSVYQALNQLSDSIGYFFAYDSKVVDNDKQIRTSINNITLEEALNQILTDTSLVYSIIDKHILISYKSKLERKKESTAIPEQQKHILVKGRVLDSQTRQPIPYATVGLPNKSLGNVTNFDGVFVFKIPKEYYATNVVVSHIGYKPQEIQISLLQNDIIDIYLSTDYVSIQEVIIRNIEPRQLVKEALSKISENYADEPYYLNSFYREGVVKDNKYQNYSEAIFKVYKSSYVNNYDTDQVKLLKSRKTQNINQSDTLSVKLRGGVNSSLTLDLVKNIPFYFQDEYWDYYNFTRNDIVNIGGRMAYEIGFEQNEQINEPLFMGVLYIDMDNLAILGAEFEINPKYISEITSQYVYKRNRHFRIKPESIKYSIRYSSFKGKYYLSHVRGDLNFKYRHRKSWFYSPFKLFFELVVSQVDDQNVTKFQRKEIEPITNVFIENNYEYDVDFWKDFNTISPEQSIFDALMQINSKIEEIQQAE